MIIPVRNGADTIGEQLDALAAQGYAGEWEVVDLRQRLDRRHGRARSPLVRSTPEPDDRRRVGPCRLEFARNFGAAHATGDFLAFCDSDDVVDPGWLAALAETARGYDAVTGRQDATVLNTEIVQRAPRSPRAEGLPRSGFLPFAPSCNLGVWADVFATTGGFDESYPQSHDVEWSWRAQLASAHLGFAPAAVVHYRYRTSTSGIWRQAYLERHRLGSPLPRLSRPRGLTRTPIRNRLRTWLWLVARAPYLASPARRGLWTRRAGEAAGRIAGSVQLRVWCP